MVSNKSRRLAISIFGNKITRETRRLNARIKKLHKLRAKTELKGCHGDSDLKAKEEALAAIRQEILELESRRESLWTGNLLQGRLDQERSTAAKDEKTTDKPEEERAKKL